MMKHPSEGDFLSTDTWPLKRRWLMISFAFLATVLNYLHRLSFNYLSANDYLRDLIPDDAFGYIATCFFIAYLLSNAVSGFIIDKLGTRLGYSLCMAFWTTAGILHALARSPFQFGLFRFLLGIGEAGNWPAAVKLTTEWFPPEERSTASGIFNSGAAAGAVIAPLLIAWLGTTFGWQITFVIIGVLGYLWLAGFWFTYYTPERSVKESKARIVPPIKLLKNKFVLSFTLSKVFIDPVWYFITFWIGRYLADTYGWDLAKIGWFAMFPFIIADFGNILGGLFTQFIIKKGVPIPKARKISAGIFGSIMAFSLMLGPFLINGPYSALAVLAVAGFGYASLTANMLAFPADVVPLSATASVYGMASVGSGLGGAIFQSLSGVAVKNLSAKFNYSTAYNAVFIGYGLLALTGMLILLFMTGPLVRNKKLEEYVERGIF
ncbi:MAG: MFS transporter [Bacteroidales bacterium]|jgi:ACS family hexuronate transporter-like MFS transporter|nr:MFS transporter [Bacteroidales bacterium]